MRSPHLLTFTSKRIFAGTAWIIAAFVVLNVIAYSMRISTELPGRRFMMVYFSLDREGNIPTFFSVIQLFFAGLLCLFISRNPVHRAERTSWTILGAGMLFMSVDEMVQLHELASRIRELSFYPKTPWLKFAWVIPGLLVVCGVGLSMIGFLRRMPRKVAFALCASGAVFVGGAIGMELVGSWAFDRFGELSYPYMACVSCEEGMEMLGIALFIRACLNYTEATSGPLSLLWPEAVAIPSSATMEIPATVAPFPHDQHSADVA